MTNRGGVITGWGSAHPDRVVTNADLPAIMNTSDEWIVERTGIRERRWGGTVAEHGTEAGRKAIEMAGLAPTDIDLLILATSAPDQIFPGTSAHVQDNLGLRCGAFDVQAACSGFVYALTTAHGFLELGMQRVLVIGAEVLSKIFAPDDRSTGVLFADGAGAVVLEAVPGEGQLLGWDLGVDGAAKGALYQDLHDFVKMDGREVFRRAVRAMVDSSQRSLERAKLTIDDIDWVIPHQANRRIIEAACQRLAFPMERTSQTVQWVGNTSSASIPYALVHELENGNIDPGDHVLLCGFGAGMTWGSTVLRWGGVTREGGHGDHKLRTAHA